jgi:hypothetical protein
LTLWWIILSFQSFCIIAKISNIQSPTPHLCFIVSRIILKRLESSLSSDNLGWIITSKEGVGLVIDFTWSHTERQYWLWNYAIIEQRPDVVLFSIYNTFLRSKSQYSIRFFTKATTFIERKELEEWAFILFLELVWFL